MNFPEAQIDLVELIRRYARSCYPEADTHYCRAFAWPVRTAKAATGYNAYSYHARVLLQGIEPYVAHCHEPKDLVIESFCGSGMTRVSCLNRRRIVVLNNLSSTAVHMASNYCTPVEAASLFGEFERLETSA